MSKRSDKNVVSGNTWLTILVGGFGSWGILYDTEEHVTTEVSLQWSVSLQAQRTEFYVLTNIDQLKMCPSNHHCLLLFPTWMCVWMCVCVCVWMLRVVVVHRKNTCINEGIILWCINRKNFVSGISFLPRILFLPSRTWVLSKAAFSWINLYLEVGFLKGKVCLYTI